MTLLVEMNLFVRRSELACPPRYLYHLLDKLGDLEGVRIRLAFLRVGTYDSLSINLLKCATKPHRLQILPALISLAGGR